MVKKYLGNGAFIYPSITLHETNSRKIELEKPPGFHKRKIILNEKLDDEYRILITDDGFVCPILPDRKKTLEFLNVLFATLDTKFHSARFINRMDLTSFEWEENSDIVDINRVIHSQSLRNNFEERRDNESSFSHWSTLPRIPIDKSMMKALSNVAYRFYKNSKFKEDMLMIGESWGLAFDEMYTASFLFSWMIIENFLEQLWVLHVNTLQRTKNEKSSLKNHNSWTASNYIEVFSMIGQLDKKGYQCLTKLRKIRNGIVHDRKKVGKKESLDCLEVSIVMLYNRLNQINPFEDVELKQITSNDS